VKRGLFLLVAGIPLIGVPVAAGLLLVLLLQPVDLPAFEAVKAAWRPSEARLLDRHGEVIHQSRVDLQGRRLDWVPLDAVSPALRQALVAAEDRRFNRHQGVDWLALGAAAVGYLTGDARRGASTLSMQLVGLLDPARAGTGALRSPAQKLDQMRAALALERRWSKVQILEAYLNRVSFRGELQGIGAASRGLFAKSPAGLGEAEATLLTALLPSPGAPSTRVARRACAVSQVAGFGIDCAQVERLAAATLDRLPVMDAEAAWAPHVAQRLLRQPGGEVRSTLDGRLQRAVWRILDDQLRGLGKANARDGAALVVDNASGDILAYVGSAGPASTAPQVDGVQALRQAGSTLKPFIYGLALERQYLTAASLLDDSPLQLETGAGLYVPQNYDRDFKGLVSVRTALASSLNIPAIRTLILTGLEPARDRLRDHGYAGITRPGEYYGYSMALGSPEVSLLEQVTAYRGLANGGRVGPLRLTDTDPAGPFRPVLDGRAAFIVGNILSDRAGRTPTFGLHNPLTTRYWSAVKTGTSKDMRDNWCIGFSRRYTVGVWVGNFEGDSMRNVSGVSGAAPAWLAIMNALHADEPSAAPESPGGVVVRQVRFDPPLEPERREWFVEGTESALVRLNDPAVGPPRIASPPQGAIIALDPDIPLDNQKVLFKARPGNAELSFVLDGEVLAAADMAVKWLPAPGRHTLVLRNQTGEVHDKVEFQVRVPR